MPEIIETINLKIATPKVDLDPLDKAVAKIQEFDALLERIAKSRTIKVGFDIQGGQLEGAVSNFRMLEGVLQSIGKTDWANGLKGGMMSTGEVAKATTAEMAKVKRELDELTAKLKVNHEAWGQQSASAQSGGMTVGQEKALAGLRKMLDMQEDAHRDLQRRLGGLGTVQGMAHAMVGLPEANTAVAKTDAAVTTAATEAASAMNAQTIAANQNAAAMERVAAATAKATAEVKTVQAAQPALTFEQQVQHAAANVGDEGWFGPRKVMVSKLFEQWKAANGGDENLQGFKDKLLQSQKKMGLELSRADYPVGLDKAALAASETAYGDERYHFVVTDRAESKAAAASHAAAAAPSAVPEEPAPPATPSGGSSQTAAAEERRKLLRERRRTNAEGEETVSSTYLEGPGRTSTISGQTVTQEMDAERAAKQRFDAIKAQFARRRAEIADGGKNSPEMREMLRLEAGAIQKELASSGLQGTSLHEQQSGRAAGLFFQAGIGEHTEEKQAARQKEMAEAKAARQQQIAEVTAAREAARAARQKEMADARQAREEMRKAAQEARAQEQERARAKSELSSHINTAISSELQQLRGLESATLKANLTDEERIAVLRQLAAEYERVSLAAGASGPNRESTRVAALNKAATLRSEASAAEESIAAHEARVQAGLASHTAELDAFGGKRSVIREGLSGSGRSETTRATRTNGDMEEALTLTRRWNAEGKEMEPVLARTSRAIKGVGDSLSGLGEQFMDNLRGMAVWSAATSILYGTIGLLYEGAGAALRMETATEGLNLTWGKGASQAAALRNEVLSLAVSEGRGADEAMQAATRWSHMHLSKEETQEGVHQSLIAANLAQAGGEEGADAGEKAKQLAAATEAYGLRVSDLSGLLDNLNSTTHGLNVTQKDLLDGLDKTAAMARHAKLPIGELVSLIGVGVSGSGQAGGAVGTTLRQIMGAAYNPKIQASLESNFGINVKTANGDLKEMDVILGAIVVKYQQMNRERQGELLNALVGRRQAGTAGAILDNFKQAQEQAAKASGSTGSAEADSLAVADTLGGKAKSIGSALSVIVADIGARLNKGIDWIWEKTDTGDWGRNKKQDEEEDEALASSSNPDGDGLNRRWRDIPEEELEGERETHRQAANRYARQAAYGREIIGLTNEGLPNARGTHSEDVSRKLASLEQEDTGYKAEMAEDRRRKQQILSQSDLAIAAQRERADDSGGDADEVRKVALLEGDREKIEGFRSPQQIARDEYLNGPAGSEDQGRLHEMAIERERLENEKRAAQLKDDFAEGGRISNRRFSAFGVGRNETERLSNEARGGASLVGDAVSRNAVARGRGETGAREAAEAAQLGVNLNQVQLQLEERRYHIARDILQARLQENEAASRSLLFADREQQLRAALLARFQQQNGGGRFTNERFSFFSKDTKEAVREFNPSLLPSGARTERQKLEEEAGQFQQSIGALKAVLDQAIGKSSSVSVNTPPASASAGTPRPPQVNLPPVTFTFAAELKTILPALSDVVRAQLQPELDSIRRYISTAVGSQGRGRAQSGGSDVVSSGD